MAKNNKAPLQKYGFIMDFKKRSVFYDSNRNKYVYTKDRLLTKIIVLQFKVKVQFK